MFDSCLSEFGCRRRQGKIQRPVKRDTAYGELPPPALFRKPDDALEFIFNWVASQGTHGSAIPLHALAMVEYLRPETAHPVLAFVGPAGSGKSGATKRTARCIDPSKSGKLADVKLTARDMAAAAQGSYVLTADNASRLDAETQDLLCKASTGAVFVACKLYAQGETVRLPLQTPVVISFVNLGISAPDLMDRTLVINVKAPPAYRNEAELEAEFLEAQPKVIGALYTLLAAGLAQLPIVVGQRQWKHRLVDFTQLGEAVLQAAGKQPGEFLAAFNDYRQHNAVEVAGGDRFMLELRRVLAGLVKDAKHYEKLPPWRQWGEGTGAAGWTAITPEPGRFIVGIKASTLLGKMLKDGGGYIPENDRQLAGALTRVQPLLRALGIEAARKDAPGKRVVWLFSFEEGALDG